MYLKSIEIQGFKSFANKMVLEFHNGITGIVGPNGSGKSNVADAVRWVLGEQRIKQLRGASMQDVIFSGTQLRKPQGFAYVAITLDNSDHQLAIEFDQVTVSRRLYRSGESEYMINGSPCRLKDINELFYDTGIGKEGYSIIGQGQIDRILSGKPEDRRELFDEAAGIVKFKRRKAIAQKKLEDEQANLVRVTDILSELEKQVGPLERQARTAREYLQLRQSLKVCEANQFVLETDQTQGQLQEIQKRRQILEGDLEEAGAQAEKARQEYDQLEAAVSQQDQAIGRSREGLNQAAVKRSGLEGQINVLREQIHTEELNQTHYESRKTALNQEIQELEVQQREYGQSRQELEASQQQIRSSLNQAQEKLSRKEQEIQGLEQEIEGCKALIIQSLNDKADLTARQQRYETMLEQVNLRRSQVSQQLLKYKSDESVQDEQIQAEKMALKQVQESLEQARLQSGQASEELEQAEGDLKRLNRNLNNAQQEYHTAYTRLESLRNLAERYEGYGGSIRRVMEVRDRIHGIHGVVANLISVPQKYETAIETALGGSIQNIVTDSEETAKQLIQYLKKNRYGRATFLPLTSMNRRQNFPHPEALNEPGVLGLADSLIQTRPEYQGLASYLLGRVVVADTIDSAIALARKFRYSLRIVTLEGELLSPGGSMTGGAFKNTSNLLGRRREMDEMKQACQKALVQAEAVQKDIHLAEGLIQEKKEELEALRGRIQALSLEENTHAISLEQLEAKKAEIAGSSVDLVQEHGQLEEQVREIGEARAKLSLESQALEERSQQAQQDSQAKNQRLEEARADRETLAADQSSIQLQAANLKQKQDFLQENLSRVQGEIQRRREELEQMKTGEGDSRQAIQDKKQEIQRCQEAIRQTDAQIQQLEEQIGAGTREKEAMAQKQKGFFQRREELAARSAALDKDMFRLQSQQEKLEERLEQSSSYMWSEYELTYKEACQMKEESFSSLSQTRQQISELKEKIRALGNVNVNAIEDYREISQRYEFMKGQHQDLVDAQAELEKIIQELDQGMRRQFSEKFSQIQAEFDKVFKELFGGGRGTLELLEDQDILEAGIQIIAQPPGKKLQNMMQLSGGEKALTAISLLFAIQNLKPSPFCLLDEIEAALDDSNVDRFARYLHKLTKNTQFIVITHRRGTMVAADRLYGITMQEKGVSALVSVNLIADELDK